MTITSYLEAAPAQSATAAPPTISPNRRRLNNRFPVLAFTIATQGRPWFEVLLATDRTLFDPANAARRTPANFYAGRQDGGLARAAGESTAYVVPAAVLRRFADARPRSSEIFYTVAAYDAPEGPPVLAMPPATLAIAAPSVVLGADFQAQTMAVVLGVPADRLRPVDEPPEPLGGRPAGASVLAAEDEVDDEGFAAGSAQSWSSDEDEDEAMAQAEEAWLEDEPQAMALDDEDDDAAIDEPAAYAAWEAPDDGAADALYGEPRETSSGASGTPYGEPYARPYGDSYAEPYDDAYAEPYGEAYAEPDDEEDVEPYGAAGVGAAEDLDQDDRLPPGEEEAGDAARAYDEEDGFAEPYGSSPEEQAEDLDYDDGFGDAQSWAEGAESSFPPGAAEPAQLSDEEDERVDGEFAAAEAYGEPHGAGDQPYALVAGNGHGGGASAAALAAAPPAGMAAPALDIPAKVAIVRKLARLFHSRDGYAAADLDPALGLRHGFVGFTGPLLERLLRMMRERDPATFRSVLGTDATSLPATDDLVRRLRTAGTHPPFQAAQNELAVQTYLEPMLPLASGFALDSERAIAMLTHAAMWRSPARAVPWVADVVGPIRTDAQRQQALGALGFPGVAEFQRSVGLEPTGDPRGLTQAELARALRRLGPASPVPLPTREQQLDAIVARAAAEDPAAGRRLQALRAGAELADVPLTWTPAPYAGSRGGG